MRYTESRLAPSAMMMVDESDEDTVNFGANYDGQILEPQVLPAAFPNLSSKSFLRLYFRF